MTEAPHSYKQEKNVLAGIIRYPETWLEISPFLTKEDFYSKYKKVHFVIFTIIKNELDQNKPIDPVLISEKINNLGITDGAIKIFDYIESLSLIQISKNGLLEAVKELKKITARREIYEASKQNLDFVSDPKVSNLKLSEIIQSVDEVHNKKINSFYTEDNDPHNLCTDLHAFIEELGENPKEHLGLITHWPHFNAYYGGLRLKDSYGFAGRAKNGKSTIMMDVAYRVANTIDQTKFCGQKKIPILFLDTEQERDENRIKLASCIANVNPALVESGRWRQNEEAVKAIRENLPLLEGDGSTYYHVYIPRLSVAEIKSICLRWYYKHVGRGNPCLIVYDYLKLSGDDLVSTSKEYLAASHKLDVLKDMVKEEINASLVFGVQRNRSALGKEAADDETSISLSDGLVQLATSLFIIKRKTPEEIAEETLKHGTHKLISVVTRKLGFDGLSNDLIKYKGKWINNFLNMDIHNYRVNEVSTGKDLANYLDLRVDSDNNKKGKKVKEELF